MKSSKSKITKEIKEEIEKLLKSQSKYELALDIGISETTLRRYILGEEIVDRIVDKIKEFIEVQWIKMK